MRDGATIRRGDPADLEPAIAVFRAADDARGVARGGAAPQDQTRRLRGHLDDPSAFLFVAEEAGTVVGMAAGMQGLADDGAGPPVMGLCHVGAVFVAPGRWGEGLGGGLVGAVLAEARVRGFTRVQLWTHAGNARAHRLYDGHGFRRTGREKTDELGEAIIHYARGL